jgi:hypothetical protein
MGECSCQLLLLYVTDVAATQMNENGQPTQETHYLRLTWDGAIHKWTKVRHNACMHLLRSCKVNERMNEVIIATFLTVLSYVVEKSQSEEDIIRRSERATRQYYRSIAMMMLLVVWWSVSSASYQLEEVRVSVYQGMHRPHPPLT